MPLLIDNEAVESVLTMADCLRRMEDALTQLGRGDATFQPVNHFWTPTAEDYFRFGSMVGLIRDPPRLAHRLKSDVLQWERHGDAVTEEWYNGTPGKYMGLVQLFDTTNGELLAIINDGVIQGYRVGATAGVACDRLSNPEAAVAGILGSGGLATAHALAFAEIRDLEEIRVYSPTRANRESFAVRMSDELDLPVVAVDDPADAMAGVDIAATCTDSNTPVLDPDWIEDGMFVCNVRAYEVDEASYGAFDAIFATANYRYPHYLIGTDAERRRIPDFHPADDRQDDATVDLDTLETQETDFPTVDQLLVGEAAGRDSADQAIFYYNCSTAIQFAAIGDLAYEGAIAAGLGRELPLAWFQQDVRD